MKFLLSLLPNRVPDYLDPSDTVLILRERILQLLLLAASVMGSIFLIISLIPSLNRSLGYLLIVAIAVFLLFSLSVARRMKYLVRSSIVIFILYVMTLGALIIYGLEGSGILLALSCSVITFLFRGSRIGALVAVINTLTVASVGVLMVTGILPPPATILQFDSTMPTGWISVGLAYTVLSIIVMSTITTLVMGLQLVAEKQKILSQELTEERNLLETRITLRTQEIEKRALQIEIASSIAHEVSQETDIEILLSNAVELMVNRFNLYYAAVFLLDNNNEFAVLRSGSGEAGKEMLDQHHQLRVGQVGMVGYVVANNNFRLAQDVKSDPTHYDNPFLPLTQSELALPLTVAGKVIGALDLQSIEKDYFTPSDIQALNIAADQIAVAIQRAQLVDQLEQSVESLETGLQIYTQVNWNSHLKSSRKNMAFSLNQSEIVESTGSSPQAISALEHGKTVIEESGGESSPGNPTSSAAIPIRLRNVILGVLEIHFGTPKVPGEIIPLLEAAANRLGIALENARLLEVVQMRAESERVVSEISSHVRSATTIDHILKTAAAELGKNLGVSDVVVQLRSAD